MSRLIIFLSICIKKLALRCFNIIRASQRYVVRFLLLLLCNSGDKAFFSYHGYSGMKRDIPSASAFARGSPGFTINPALSSL